MRAKPNMWSRLTAREFGSIDETQFRKIVLAAISATIITAVSATTNQVRRSLWAAGI